jgi:hypothetical protein
MRLRIQRVMSASDLLTSKLRASDVDPQTRRTVEGLFVGLFLGALCWGVLIGIALAVLS